MRLKVEAESVEDRRDDAARIDGPLGGESADGIALANDFAAFDSPAAGFNTGVLWRNPVGNLSLEAKGDYVANGEIRRSLSLNQQWEVSRNLGVRLSAQREFSKLTSPINEVMLEVKWYHY